MTAVRLVQVASPGAAAIFFSFCGGSTVLRRAIGELWWLMWSGMWSRRVREERGS
jgi:hypothetical protein